MLLRKKKGCIKKIIKMGSEIVDFTELKFDVQISHGDKLKIFNEWSEGIFQGLFQVGLLNQGISEASKEQIERTDSICLNLRVYLPKSGFCKKGNIASSHSLEAIHTH